MDPGRGGVNTADIRNELRCLVNRFSTSGNKTIADIWRALQTEASTLLVQDLVESAIDSQNLKLQVEIMDHCCTTTRHGYSFKSATVNIRRQNSPSSFRLLFRYERQSVHEANGRVAENIINNPTVSYTIDFLDGRQDSETLAKKLLWVQIWAANPSRPSLETHLIEMLDHEHDHLSLSSKDSDVHGENKLSPEIVEALDQDLNLEGPPRKKPRTTSEGSESINNVDHFVAGIDNDLLQRVREILHLSMNDVDSCQFLLKFPFAEYEWNLEGMLFDALFGDEHEGRCDEP